MPSPPSSAPTGAGFAFCADSNLAHFCDPLNSIEIGGVCCEPHRHNVERGLLKDDHLDDAERRPGLAATARLTGAAALLASKLDRGR